MLFSLQTANDFMVICNVAKILELVVPLMEHPSETFLATIEEDLMKLIIKYGMTVRVADILEMSFGLFLISSDLFIYLRWFSCLFVGGPALCELSRSSCKQSHTQLQVCVGLLQQILWWDFHFPT